MGNDSRGAAAEGAYATIGDLASRLNVGIDAGELAGLAVRRDLGDEGPAAIRDLSACLADRRHQAAIEMPPRLGRLPRKAPKTFEGLGFPRIQGRDAAALRRLPSPPDPHARKSIALTGPGGMGKTHPARAYGHECRTRGCKAHCLKAGEPRDELAKAAERGDAARAPGTLVRPSRLMVGEAGRCVFDRARTDLFLDVVDRRLREGGAEHAHPHRRRARQRLGRVLHGRRRAAVRPGQDIRQGVGPRHARSQLQGSRVRDLLGGVRPVGDQGPEVGGGTRQGRQSANDALA